jgi:hypothetical protein
MGILKKTRLAKSAIKAQLALPAFCLPHIMRAGQTALTRTMRCHGEVPVVWHESPFIHQRPFQTAMQINKEQQAWVQEKKDTCAVYIIH